MRNCPSIQATSNFKLNSVNNTALYVYASNENKLVVGSTAPTTTASVETNIIDWNYLNSVQPLLIPTPISKSLE